MKQLISFTILVFALSSCLPRLFKVPEGDLTNTNIGANYVAGASSVDITPFPGSTMAGYGGDIGQITRGNLGRLYVHTTYIEDGNGNYVFIVACDLWAFARGIGDRVIEAIKNDNPIPNINFDVARDNVLFTATHTHNAQGNFSTSYGYNIGSSTYPGFNKEQFRFLIKSITESMNKAYQAKQAVDIYYTTGQVFGLSRNRSLLPWLNNRPEDLDVFWNRFPAGQNYSSNAPECIADDNRQFVAVNPDITSIVVQSRNTGNPISIINNFGAHPTVLGADSRFASADVFGVAASQIRNYYRFRTVNNEVPVVSFINGAQGDISMNWQEQGRAETVRLGEQLGSEIINMLRAPLTPLARNINVSTEFVRIKGKEVDDPRYESTYKTSWITKTARVPLAGKSIIYGAEDARVDNKMDVDECSFIEGKRTASQKPAWKRHGSKDRYIITLAAGKSSPTIIPFSIIDLGELRMIGIPGECTVTLAERIIDASTNAGTQHYMIAGLANEYTSYLTTPEEYKLQHYEGASTIWGLASGLFFEQGYNDLSLQGPSTRYHGYKWHFPGIIFFPYKKRSIQGGFKNERINAYGILKSIGHSNPIPTQDYINWNWQIPYDISNPDVPEVELEYLNGPNWQSFYYFKIIGGVLVPEEQTDKASYNILNYTIKEPNGNIVWESSWMRPPNVPNGTQVRFKLSMNGNPPHYSPTFIL